MMSWPLLLGEERPAGLVGLAMPGRGPAQPNNASAPQQRRHIVRVGPEDGPPAAGAWSRGWRLGPAGAWSRGWRLVPAGTQPPAADPAPPARTRPAAGATVRSAGKSWIRVL